MRSTKMSHAKDAYLELVRQHPLRPLRNRQQHADAVKFLSRTSLLHQGSRDSGVLDYLEILADLIDQFERAAQLKVDVSGASPTAVVRHLIAANQLTVSVLAREIGIGQSNLSEMLSGRREFSRRAIVGIRDRFGVSPEIFF
jgi:antitoxin component HigA of HigAB toxin-antitoxin module